VAVLASPVVLCSSALAPAAVFWLPVTFRPNAKAPAAVLSLPASLDDSAPIPDAVFSWPVVFEVQGLVTGRSVAAARVVGCQFGVKHGPITFA
jgi:hypothetical protein